MGSSEHDCKQRGQSPGGYLRYATLAWTGLPVAVRCAASASSRRICRRVRWWFICIFSNPVRATLEDLGLSEVLGLRAMRVPIVETGEKRKPSLLGGTDCSIWSLSAGKQASGQTTKSRPPPSVGPTARLWGLASSVWAQGPAPGRLLTIHNDRALVAFGSQRGATLLHVVERLLLGYEQTQLLSSRCHGPPIDGRLYSEDRLRLLLDHTCV
jgi:hypothetical protein